MNFKCSWCFPLLVCNEASRRPYGPGWREGAIFRSSFWHRGHMKGEDSERRGRSVANMDWGTKQEGIACHRTVVLITASLSSWFACLLLFLAHPRFLQPVQFSRQNIYALIFKKNVSVDRHKQINSKGCCASVE